ncbi:hypothetical protein SNE40_012660 [Patella caerulea]|uniref:Glucokinase regulatory protein second SIS domain-containing protein n=1 Tax=Patella caerulea TaxID=87958 RepID=A0AAN8JRQ3_PATCE
MKGGTATKLILESIFVSALSTLHVKGQNIIAQLVLNSYETVYQNVYKEKEQIAKVVKLAGKSLNSGGCIYYVGWDSLGIMGLMDASECRPTYGASLDEVRGFLYKSYSNLRNKEGSLSHVGKHYLISIEDFSSNILPGLRDEDIVILLTTDSNFVPDANLLMKPCKKVVIVVNTSDQKPTTLNPNIDVFLKVTISQKEITQLTSKEMFDEYKQLYYEVATKWILNSISTGAYVLVGKVYQNIMIDLKASNNKLFYRAVNIIQNFSGLASEICTEFLLRAIYEEDDLTDEQILAPVTSHIHIAADKNKVIPIALVAALLDCGINEAKEKIEKERILRTVMLNALKYSK